MNLGYWLVKVERPNPTFRLESNAPSINTSLMNTQVWLALILLISVESARSGEPSPSPLKMEAGDIYFCESCPSYDNSELTTFQLARLAFSTVKEFQESHGLKVDGRAGPITQAAVKAEYEKVFGPGPTTNVIPTNLICTVTDTGVTTITNSTSQAIRICGLLKHASANKIDNVTPALTYSMHWCEQRGPVRALMSRRTTLSLCPSDTVIPPLGMCVLTNQTHESVSTLNRIPRSFRYVDASGRLCSMLITTQLVSTNPAPASR